MAEQDKGQKHGKERSGELPISDAGALWDAELEAILVAIRDALFEWEDQMPDPIGRQTQAVYARLPQDMRKLWPSTYHRYRKVDALRHMSIVTLLAMLGYLRGDVPQALVDLAVRMRSEVGVRLAEANPLFAEAGLEPADIGRRARERRALMEAFDRLPDDRRTDLVEMARLWGRAGSRPAAGAVGTMGALSWTEEEALRRRLDQSAEETVETIRAAAQRARTARKDVDRVADDTSMSS